MIPTYSFSKEYYQRFKIDWSSFLVLAFIGNVSLEYFVFAFYVVRILEYFVFGFYEWAKTFRRDTNLQALLKQTKLKYFQIKRDGNCLFDALRRGIIKNVQAPRPPHDDYMDNANAFRKNLMEFLKQKVQNDK